MIEKYRVILTDVHGSLAYDVEREEVGNFINGINWETVLHFTVDPLGNIGSRIFSLDAIEDVDSDFDITLKEGEVQEDDWWDLYGLVPSHNFEINHEGTIRIKVNQKVLEPTEFDFDLNCWVVVVKINGVEYYLNGKRIAAEMKKEV